jgi:hypothetical protein
MTVETSVVTRGHPGSRAGTDKEVEVMRLPRIRSLVVTAAVMFVAASAAPVAAGSRVSVAASGADPGYTAAGWLALAIAITALVLAIGFVMITSARGPHRPGHRGGHPRAT